MIVRGAHAGGDAEGGEGGFLVGALELVEGGAEDHRAGGAERVAHGDGAAVDVDAGGVDVEGLQEAEDDGGEGLVDLEEVDVGDAPCRRSRRIFSVTGTGPVSMIVGSVPILAVALMRARGLRPWRTPKSRSPIRTRGGAVDDAGGVAGVVDVVDPLEVRGISGSPRRRSRAWSRPCP